MIAPSPFPRRKDGAQHQVMAITGRTQARRYGLSSAINAIIQKPPPGFQSQTAKPIGEIPLIVMLLWRQ
ncbi:hypothetical protein ATY79_19010 [Rhizobium sp. R693]|nr:hypothetical protein ATY79_19010 [Rhizobium sp. R693]